MTRRLCLAFLMLKHKSVKVNKDPGKGKKRRRKKRIDFILRLIFRFMALCYFVGIYIMEKSLMDPSYFPKWSGVYVMCGIILAGFVFQFLPLTFHPAGWNKWRKSGFLPSPQYKSEPNLSLEEIKEIHRMDKGFAIVLLLYAIPVVATWVLYYMRILGAPEMFLIVLALYFGEMVAYNLFCPLRLVMRNKCCNTCRLNHWHPLMMVAPFLAVPGVVTWTLAGFAVVFAFMGELNCRMHPERFLEKTNAALRCEKCDRNLCPKKRKDYLKKAFFDE